MGYAVIRWIMRRFLGACFRLTVTGEEHIPSSSPVILASNHPSQMDPVVLGAALPRRVTFLAAAELLTMPVLGALVRPFRPVPVKRGQFDLHAMKECLSCLGRGNALLLFPEGRISRNGHLQPARDGLAFLALRSRIPVIPVGVRGTFQVWPLGTRFPHRGRIEVRIGPPILPQGDPTRAGQTALTSQIMKAIAELSGEPASPAPAIRPAEPDRRPPRPSEGLQPSLS